MKAEKPRRVGWLGRVKPTFSLSNTLENIFGQDSELNEEKFMRGRVRWDSIAKKENTLKGMKTQESTGLRRCLNKVVEATNPHLAQGPEVESFLGE